MLEGMAVTQVAQVANTGRTTEVLGRTRQHYLKVTMSNSYIAGGDPFDPKATIGTAAVRHVELNPRWAAGVTGPINKSFFYDPVAKTIVAIVGTTGVEVANAVDLSGCVFDVVVVTD